MKKIISLALAAGLLVGATTQANAADVEISGGFTATGGFLNNADFAEESSGSTFKLYEEIELSFGAVVSDELSGTLTFTVMSNQFGDETTGGVDLTSNITASIDEAFIEFLVPNTPLSAIVGVQGYALPGYLGSGVNPVFDDTAAGIVLAADLGMLAPELAWFVMGDDSAGHTNDTLALTIPVMLNDDMTLTPWAAYYDAAAADTFGGATFDAAIGDINAGAGAIYATNDDGSNILVEAHFAMDLGMLVPGVAVWYGMNDNGPTDFGGSWGAFNGSADTLFDNGNGLQEALTAPAPLDALLSPFSTLGVAVSLADIALADFASLGAHVIYAMDSTDLDLGSVLEVGASLYTSVYEELEFIVDANYVIPMPSDSAIKVGNGLGLAATLAYSF